jgi:hypothetical protein
MYMFERGLAATAQQRGVLRPLKPEMEQKHWQRKFGDSNLGYSRGPLKTDHPQPGL